MPSDLGWFDEWWLWLTSYCPRPDWPADDVWEAELHAALRRAGPAADVTLEVAQEAARRLNTRGMPYPDKFIPAFVAELQDALRAASMQAAGPGADREAAQRASLGCPECGGMGLTSRRLAAPERLEARYPGGLDQSCYCHRCPIGRWMRAHHLAHSPAIARRIIDLRSRPDLTADDDAELDAPLPQAEAASALAAMARKPIGRRVERARVDRPRLGPFPNVSSLLTDRESTQEGGQRS